MERKFVPGDKVVPISKTVPRYKGLHNCPKWAEAKKSQGHLYVLYFSDDVGAYVVSDYKFGKGGSYYFETDLIPYQLDATNAFEQLVNGRITEKQYEDITRTTGSEV